jgi:hypothetical protein
VPLETVDLEGVEILRAGGPFVGKGSPPGGDFYTAKDIAAIAGRNQQLSGEVFPANKIGHSKEQRLITNTFGAGEDEMPAGGWLDNIRADGDRLLADLKRVPKKLASLIDAGAFRKRSVELGTVRSQSKGGEQLGPVVTGLAWLGAKAPAVRTLDDVVALYAEQDDPEVTRTVEYEPGETADAWEPGDGFYAWRAQVEEAIEGEGVSVLDLARGRALADEDGIGWVIPYTVDDEGTVELADRQDWELAQPSWVEAATRHFQRTADTKGVTEVTLSEEQVARLAEITGIEPEELTADRLMEAAEGAVEEPDEDEGDVTDDEGEADREMSAEARAEWEQLVTRAERGDRAYEELHNTRRDAFLQQAMDEGKIEPGALEKWQRRYDADEEETRDIIADIEVSDKRRVFGQDGEPDEQSGEGRSFAQFADVLAIDQDERL